MLEPLQLSLVYTCVYFSKKKKKRMDNCPTLLKKVCRVQYNLPHPPLKVIMAFEWSCDMSQCQNPFPSPLYVCVFVSQKNKKGNCPTLLKRVCSVQYNLPHLPLKVIMAFEQNCSVPLCQNPFPSLLCVFVFQKKKKKRIIVPHCLRKCVVCSITCSTLS